VNAAGVAGGGAEQQGRVERGPVPWSQCRGDTGAVAKRKGLDTDVLHRRAQVAVLAGLVRGDDVYDLITAAASNHVPGWFSPDLTLINLVRAPRSQQIWARASCRSSGRGSSAVRTWEPARIWTVR
jgi:hypothetical protein